MKKWLGCILIFVGAGIFFLYPIVIQPLLALASVAQMSAGSVESAALRQLTTHAPSVFRLLGMLNIVGGLSLIISQTMKGKKDGKD